MVADLMPASSPSLSSMQLDLVAVALGPARVHAQQHLGPILALGAAGAGVDFEIGVVGVGLAREQRLRARARAACRLKRAKCGLGFADDGLVALGFGELDQVDLRRRSSRFEPRDGGELICRARCARASASGRALRIVPEVGVFGLGVQLVEARRRLDPSQRCLLSRPSDLLDLVDDCSGFRRACLVHLIG